MLPLGEKVLLKGKSQQDLKMFNLNKLNLGETL